MTANEVGFVGNMMKIDNYIQKVQEEIKEKFNVDSNYNSDTDTLHINESNGEQLSIIKQYVLSRIDENLITIE